MEEIRAEDVYYITDLSENYYRLDSEGQLVVAAGKEQAGIFNLCEVQKKLGDGKRAAFYKAVSINGAKALSAEKLLDHTKVTALEKEEEVKTDSKCEYDISKLDWCEYLRNFCYLTSTATNYLNDLQKQLSDVDLEICDLLHYIELCEIREDEEEKLVRALKDARLRRRCIKDALDAVKQFQESIGNNANLIKAKKVLKHLETLEQRKYVPRKLPELFKNSIKDTRYPLVQVKETERYEEPVETNEYEDRRVVHMSDVRRDTIFDNKKMDWLQFAKEQVEFYKNAEQHIVNLQIDIGDIEEEIESTLRQIEEGSFSAVQGYMVFKKLRDLRTERKEKMQELEAVSILVEPFNCEAMQEHYEDSLAEIQDLMENELPVKADVG